MDLKRSRIIAVGCIEQHILYVPNFLYYCMSRQRALSI